MKMHRLDETDISGRIGVDSCVLGAFLASGWDDCELTAGGDVVVSDGDQTLPNSALSTLWTLTAAGGTTRQWNRNNADTCTTPVYDEARQPQGCATGFKIPWRARYRATNGTSIGLQLQPSLFEILSDGSFGPARAGENDSHTGDAPFDVTHTGEMVVSAGAWNEDNRMYLEITATFSGIMAGDEASIEFEFGQPEPL